ncbi:MAG: M24 family metallopeptidase [Chloroflexota bacterium]
MPSLPPPRLAELRSDFENVLAVLETCDAVDKTLAVPSEEFARRQRAVRAALSAAGFEAGFVFSDEHYAGDVPYLAGNTNISIEQVAGVMSETGFHVIAGLEGGYVVEQLASRANAIVHKVELLQLADAAYPIDAERLEDVFRAATGAAPGAHGPLALLTPRQVIPDGIVAALEALYGSDGVVDAQELFYTIKYEKSDIEMALTRDAARIGDAMMRAMLAVLRPGQLETQVAAWAYWVARELGAEEMGFDVMVGANTANRTLIGKALNRPIRAGDYVHLGAAPKRDGLNACVRRSVVATDGATPLTDDQRFWFDFVEEAYQVADTAYRKVAAEALPARLHEQALVDYFISRQPDVSRRVGRPIDLVRQKPYTSVHNGGYTECQEFYGAITLTSDAPLGKQIVNMLDVAIRGGGDYWDDIVIPGLEYVVIENTLGKSGPEVECFSHIPAIPQALVGRVA